MTEQVQQVTVPKAAVPQSRLGKRPIPVPKGVVVTIAGPRVEVKGPKGTLTMTLPGQTSVVQEQDELRVVTSAEPKEAPRLQGLARALVAALVKGAAEGYTKTLEFVGTGYRAELKGQKLTMQLGFSHPVHFELPPGLTATIPPDSKGTILILSAADKSVLGQAAATIHGFRPPEPYGGKGVRFKGEQIRRKAGKSGKGRK
jgi:large subunit ribosomal protein L6